MSQVFDNIKRILSASGRRVEYAISIVVTLIGLVVFAFVGIGGNSAAGFAFIQNIELRSLDARFQLRGPRATDDRIVIVGIDEKTLSKVGAWPIPRNAYAQLVDKLSADGASIVAMDVTFPTPEKNSAVEALKKLVSEIQGKAPAEVIARIREIQGTSDNDLIFAESMKKANNVVLGHIFLGADRAKGADASAAEDYYNVLWGHPFPRMNKVEGNFDLGTAYTNAGGPTGESIEANIRLLAEASRSYGFFNNIPDRDGTFRRAFLLYRYKDREWFPSLAMETIRQYENIKDQSMQAYMAENGIERVEMGPYVFHTWGDGSLLINFAGPYHSYKHYSMADVIGGELPAGTFKNKIVLVGATAIGIGDLRVTPFQSADYMGVEVHANQIDNILNSEASGRGFLKRGFSQEALDLFFIVLFGVGLCHFFGRLKPWQAALLAVVAFSGFALFVFVAFKSFGVWLHFVVPVATLVANYGGITTYRMIFEEREKRKIRKQFGQYVSPGVIALIEKDPAKYLRLGGDSKELTVMFSDIRNFTTMSEGMTPDELVTFLNEYLGEMTDIIFRRWGTLDKYIGDAVMAFWGSPYPQDDHAIRACACALEMCARLDELNLKWEMQGLKQFSIGVGLNTGTMNVGNMGSGKRIAYTVMGDNVNLGSRLEGTSKEYGVRIVISESTFKLVKDHYVIRELDKIRVKGKLKPVAIYELIAFAKDQPQFDDLLGRWDEALEAYRRQAWSVAADKFAALLKKYPDDGPSKVFLERCVEKRDSASFDAMWDGVFVMTHK